MVMFWKSKHKEEKEVITLTLNIFISIFIFSRCCYPTPVYSDPLLLTNPSSFSKPLRPQRWVGPEMRTFHFHISSSTPDSSSTFLLSIVSWLNLSSTSNTTQSFFHTMTDRGPNHMVGTTVPRHVMSFSSTFLPNPIFYPFDELSINF